MEKDRLRHILGRLDTKTLGDLPHYVFPSPNLHKHKVLEPEDVSDQEESCLEHIRLATKYYRQFPYDSSLPVPIVEPKTVTMQAVNGGDPVQNLVRSKIDWEERKDDILSANLKDKKSIDKNTVRSMRNIKHNRLKNLPRGITALASHLAQDPDPCFSGTYNWYYSGGTLATLSSGDNSFILSSSAGVNESALQIMTLSKDENGWKSQEMNTINMTNNISPIHQVLTTNGYVAVRQKEQITVLVPEESENGIGLNLKWLHTAVTDKNEQATFVSTSVSLRTDLQYCTLSSDGIVRLWQPRAKTKCISEMKIHREKGPMDNWGSVQYHDRNTILMLNRNRIYLLDIRTMKKVQSWCHSNLCEVCEDLSMCVGSSRQQHLKYIGTNHQVFGLDVRFGFSQRWTHLMSSPPYIGCTTPVNRDGELLLFGSQNLQEVSAIVNNCNSDNTNSDSLPVCLPSLLETLREVRVRSACLVSYAQMRSRMSLTGLYCLPGHDSLLLLRQNSLGDIFLQELQNKKDRFKNRLSNHDIELLKDWGNLCAKAVGDPDSVTVTSFAVSESSTDISFKMADAWIWPELHPSTNKNNSKCRRYIERWQISKQFLEECVDDYSSKLYSSWEIEDEDEWIDREEEIEEEEIEEEEEDPTHKVRSWLDSAPLKFETDIPGIEPLVEEEIYNDEEKCDKYKEKFSTKKSFLNTRGITKDRHIQPQGVLQQSADNISVTSLLSQKRRLSTSPVLTPILKKRKSHNAGILDGGSVNSLPLPKRTFLNAPSSGLKSSASECGVQSRGSYSLTQEVRKSQTYGYHSPKPFTPHRLKNLSPLMFGSELDNIVNAPIISKPKKTLETTPVPQMSQQLSSQHDVFAGRSPRRSQLDPDFPITPHSSQKPGTNPQKIQSLKKTFVAGF